MLAKKQEKDLLKRTSQLNVTMIKKKELGILANNLLLYWNANYHIEYKKKRYDCTRATSSISASSNQLANHK